MSIKKDKVKVLGENFDDERIKTFLNVLPYGGLSKDYVALEKAYRSMIPENFATFVRFFVEAGMDLNTRNAQGRTFAEEIGRHRHADAYLEALRAAGTQ